VHGASSTVPLIVADRLVGVADVALHLTPKGYDPIPVKVWNSVAGHFFPEFEVTFKEFAVLK
jgi:hypothetical protein